MGFFAIRIISGLTEPLNQQPEAEQGEQDIISAVVDKPVQEEGTITMDGGDTYSGQLLGGVAHGYGVWIGPDGSFYEGDFANSMFNGLGTITWLGKVYLCRWKRRGRRMGRR